MINIVVLWRFGGGGWRLAAGSGVMAAAAADWLKRL